MADVTQNRTTVISVKSTVAEHLTVAIIRDFVAALDTAGIPDSLEVRRRADLGRGLEGLYVAYAIDEPVTGTPASAASTAGAGGTGPGR